jgi:hypothetical protein
MVEAGLTLSLFDEISLIIESRNNRFFIPETLTCFSDLVQWLRLNDILGNDWYSRIEAGEHLIGWPVPDDFIE